MIDVKTYRRDVQDWRRDYARLSASIRQAKRDSVQPGAGQPERQRTLAILQRTATSMLMERAWMKDDWRMAFAPRVIRITLGAF